MLNLVTNQVNLPLCLKDIMGYGLVLSLYIIYEIHVHILSHLNSLLVRQSRLDIVVFHTILSFFIFIFYIFKKILKNIIY